MRRRSVAPVRVAGFLLACLAVTAGVARASERAARPASLALVPASLTLPSWRAPDFLRAAADSDTTLDSYLGGMADSTEQWFGLSAAPPDTAGLDSALAWRLENPEEDSQPGALRLGFTPYIGFNRVDGPVYGGAPSIGEPQRLGELTAEVRYAVGPNDWMGGGTYHKVVNRRGSRWTGRLSLRRETTGMDREHPDWQLASLRAFLIGKDRKHYLGREGLGIELRRETETTRLEVWYRDMRERPLATTTTWNLTNRELSVIENLPAARGRARELGFEATARVPLVPVTVEVSHQTSGPSIGSDFDYRRLRLAASGEFGVAGLATLIPQASYGRLSGIPIPQQSFYLGGSHSLRSLSSSARAGSHMIVGRFDLIGAFDVLEKLHVPHPAAFPIQVGAFAATGAAWGVDPFGGPTVAGGDWPRKEIWMHEAGLSLFYQPGIPDPTHLIRLSYAWPIGPEREVTHWSLSYTRAIDLVHRLGGGD